MMNSILRTTTIVSFQSFSKSSGTSTLTLISSLLKPRNGCWKISYTNCQCQIWQKDTSDHIQQWRLRLEHIQAGAGFWLRVSNAWQSHGFHQRNSQQISAARMEIRTPGLHEVFTGSIPVFGKNSFSSECLPPSLPRVPHQGQARREERRIWEAKK